ncbi:chromatin modification- protein eaf6 [Haplosporangium sp. Z 767]|nr:chromatin modification- protein eaf6 [Haplosporangium sp. Z 767]
MSIPKDKVTHQQYIDAKNELADLMARKKLVDRNLAGLENSIYAFEGSYLDDTQHGGNIIRGFDGYINTKADKSRALQIKESQDAESSQDESKRSSSTSSSKRPSLKTSNSSSNIAPPSSIGSSSSSSLNRRLLKQQKSSSQTKSSDQRPPKKQRLSSTGRDADGDEDLDV